MFTTIYDHLLPTIRSKYDSKLQIIFRQQIQPWHPSSTLVHEAGAAVLRLSPAKFYDFSKALFDDQAAFFDVNVVNETRNNTYKRLAKIAAGVGLDEGEVFGLLEISDKPGKDGSLNTGNKVTDDVKVMVKVSGLGHTTIFSGVFWVVARLMLTFLFLVDEPPCGNSCDADRRLQCKFGPRFLCKVLETDLLGIKGVVENSISSSFTKEQWEEWLQKNVV